MSISSIIRVALGAVIVVGGLVFAVISGAPDLCDTPSGYCIDFHGLEPFVSAVGMGITAVGWVLIARVVRRPPNS